MEPLAAERLRPGVFAVRNLRSGGRYRVRIDDGLTCNCDDYRYRAGSGGACKHIQFIEQISTGELCPACGYGTCRPSCPERARVSTREAMPDE
jgi:hypothetical protein